MGGCSMGWNLGLKLNGFLLLFLFFLFCFCCVNFVWISVFL